MAKQQATPARTTLRTIRFWLGIEVFGLVVSGVTAFPLLIELRFGQSLLHAEPLRSWLASFATGRDLTGWLDRVYTGLSVQHATYPFLAYGTDWLAFAHLVIALAFIGPLRDPVRNVWVIRWGMLACVGIIPLALIAGPVRGIPFGWSLIDMSFGVVGIVPLLIANHLTGKLARQPSGPTSAK